jgi:hypothetical protein
MALVHRATLKPTKLELLTAWLPGRDWYRGSAEDLVRVAGYRFDDPAGEVGIETLLVRAGEGPVHQVPLTYRGAPLAGGEDWLVGTVEHSVLGPRWVYDGCGDPVYAAALAVAILADNGQAEELVEIDGRLERRELTMTIATVTAAGAVAGDVAGDPALVATDSVELTVVRRPDAGNRPAGATLTGAWTGQPTPLPLAYATPLS